ncbi:MAG: flagellar biosynthesis protein FlhB [Candidatus Coatesbacteria bacterium]|nr:flagellar biosynthesis protein FlhB [Candidatus Coatesbacteria bacterium]
MSTPKGEKTEEATPRRIKKARERGQVAKSKEFPSALVLGTAILYFWIMGSGFLSTISNNIKTGLGSLSNPEEFTLDSVQSIFRGMVSFYSRATLPFMFCILVIVVVANLLQSGFIFTAKPLQPKFSKLNPISGLKRVFGSVRTIAETATNSMKLLVVALIGYITVGPELSKIPNLLSLSVVATVIYLSKLAFILLFRVFIFLMILALFDFFYRKYEYKKNLRMSKQEVRDEFKEVEGDPLIKRRIRQRQFEMARRRMMSDVPKADVVITNPTRIAVALKYTGAGVPAPLVVAKGAGAIAKRIISIAVENDVQVVENKPLAQVLFNTVDVGDIIPESLYRAVADVLAYVYKLKSRMAKRAGVGRGARLA